MKVKGFYGYIALGLLILFVAFLANISLGSIRIPFSATLKILLLQPVENDNWQYIILNYRLPKALTAILAGSGLALSGLFMQTLFQNPLAGPYVLGLSSGASLGVALLIMGGGIIGITGSLFLANWGIIIAASLGSFLVMLAVVAASFRLKNTMGILIVGIMFAAISGSLVTLLSYFSTSELLQRFVFWSFGSLGHLSSSELLSLSLIWSLGLFLGIFTLKNLNALLLGEKYAKSMGVNIKKNRLLVIASTCILTGSITAFAGPIAFIGLAVPHLVRLLIPSANHQILAPGVLICGALFLLICDSVAQLPGNVQTLPINAVTSLVGAPVVIWLLLRKRKMIF